MKNLSKSIKNCVNMLKSNYVEKVKYETKYVIDQSPTSLLKQAKMYMYNKCKSMCHHDCVRGRETNRTFYKILFYKILTGYQSFRKKMAVYRMAWTC